MTTWSVVSTRPEGHVAKSLDIAPLEREALPARIVRQVVGLVRRGELKPGDRLPSERALAEELGVGRPTLREALRALQLLGVLDIRHGGGVFVSRTEPDTLLGPLRLFLSPNEHDLESILEAREVIEGALLALVARKIDEPLIRKLEANLDALETSMAEAAGRPTDPARLHALAEEFRGIVEEAVDNPILSRAVQSLDLLCRAVRERMFETAPLDRLLVNHRRMVQALIRHEPDTARQALEEHVAWLREVAAEAARSGRAHA